MKYKFADKWKELETVILNEVTQIQRQTSHVLSHLWMLAFHL